MIDEEKSTYIDQSRQENANYKEVIIDIKQKQHLWTFVAEKEAAFL